MKGKFSSALSLALIVSMLFTSIAQAAVWTDQEDYSPGSVVTISGDNSDGAGYLAGETVHVDVWGPNSYTAACDAVADNNGAWSCQVTLWDSALAVGDYAYTATGMGSGVSQNGAFTDALQTTTTVASSNNPSTFGQPVTFTATVKSGNPATTPVTQGLVTFGTGTNCTGGFTAIGSVGLDASGQATFTTSSLPQGNTTIRACYQGFGSGPSALQTSGGFVIQTVNSAPPPNTAPTVTVTGVTDGASYEFGSVPAAVCEVTDAEDGNSTFPATLSAITGSLSAYGLGSQTASCSYTDGGGLSDSDSAAYSIVDTTAPTITFVSRTPLANANGWNNTDVTVNWSCSDNVGVVSASVSQTLTTEGASQSAVGTCTDLVGLTSSDTQTGINIDKTKPTISAAATTSPNAAGWYKGDVIVAFTCGDALSGIPAGACPADETLSTEGSAVSSTAMTVTDTAGNTSDLSNVVTVKIDLTAPSLTWNGGPADGGTYYFGFVPPAPTCDAADALSGPDGCSVGGYSAAVGSPTMTATAYDVAGNSYSETRTYTVLAWDLKGFYQPVDMGGVFNTVKGGSTVPLKFEIFAGVELTDINSIQSIQAYQVTCNANTIEDSIETVSTGGTSLRYDWTSGQFIFNWKTPKSSGSCYKVTMTTLDGSSLSAFFKLK